MILNILALILTLSYPYHYPFSTPDPYPNSNPNSSPNPYPDLNPKPISVRLANLFELELENGKIALRFKEPLD